jgi:hypothetical protein
MFVCLFFFRFHHKSSRTTTITNKTATTIPVILLFDILDFFLEDLDFPRARETNCRRGRTRLRNDLLSIIDGLFARLDEVEANSNGLLE